MDSTQLMGLEDMKGPLVVAWHREIIGTANARGEFRFLDDSPCISSVFSSVAPGKAPATLENLQPEGWLAAALDLDPDEYKQHGLRFLGNLTVAAPEVIREFLETVPEDVVGTSITVFTDAQNVFSGTYEGISGSAINSKFEAHLAAYWENRLMPRLSGAQMKLPMTLLEDGRLIPAINTPFSHILKPPGKSSEARDALGVAEWMGLELSEAAGLPTAKHALVEMPEGLPPALLVERFDIPTADEVGTTRIYSQDFCSAGRIKPENKYGRPLEKCAAIVKEMSTQPKLDMEVLYKRTVLAWIMHDNDMHLKNISLLKRMDIKNPESLNVSFAPTYDAVTTCIFPDLCKGNGMNEMALSVGNKRKNFTHHTFIKFGEQVGIGKQRAEEILKEVATDVSLRAVQIAKNMPDIVTAHKECVFAVQRIATEVVERAQAMGGDVPDWQPVNRERFTDFEKAVRWQSRRINDEHPASRRHQLYQRLLNQAEHEPTNGS